MKFGTAFATSVVVVHPALITCVSPSNSFGTTVGVTVTNTDGSTATLANAYTNIGTALVASAASSHNVNGNNTATINSTGATLLVAMCAGFAESGDAVTDSLGNTWTKAPFTGGTIGASTPTIFYAYSHSGGALATGSGHIITFHGGTYGSGTIYAFSGTKTDSSVFGTGVGAGNSNLSSPIAGTSITPTQGDLLVCGIMANQVATGPTISGNGDGNTWSTPQGDGSNGTVQSWWASYATALTTTTSNPKWTRSGVTQAGEVMASFHSA